MRRVEHRLPRPKPSPSSPALTPLQLRLALASRLLRHLGFAGAAWARGGPGLRFHARVVAMCTRLAATAGDPATRVLALETLAFPMEAIRYFEFGTAWAWAADRTGPMRVLDVSSPRLFPLLLARHRPGSRFDLVNPDGRDLEVTARWMQALGLTSCVLHRTSIAETKLEAGSYDLVTSLSVLEHIPEPADLEAVARMWGAVRPGGRMILTLPCARESFEEYLDLDEYGLLEPDANGFVFGQRFYDEALLRRRVLAICGNPRRTALLGERTPGSFVRDRSRKVAGDADLAREPLAAAVEYRRYPSLETLPGIGVLALEFEKPPVRSASARQALESDQLPLLQ